jgi:23S rRNA (uracil1939-C5)-methyltransferase/tRNA (uracil-5-)-methyltransferase
MRHRLLALTRRGQRLCSTTAVATPPNFKPEPFGYHEELTLRIDDLTNRGFGVARHDGFVVMVPEVIPGELVLARVFRNHKSYSEADLVSVLEPSESRKEPDCALFGVCGGCQYQHMTIDEQRKWKRKQVVDSLERLAKAAPKDFPGVEELIGTQDLYGYRCKLTPHYDVPKGRTLARMTEEQTIDGLPPHEVEVDFPIGFFETSRRRLVDVPMCPIATPAINTELKAVRVSVKKDVQERLNGVLRQRAAADESTEARKRGEKGTRRGPGKTIPKVKGATLLFRDVDAGVATSHRNQVAHTIPHPLSTPIHPLADLSFEFRAADFFQNNLTVLPVLNASPQDIRTVVWLQAGAILALYSHYTHTTHTTHTTHNSHDTTLYSLYTFTHCTLYTIDSYSRILAHNPSYSLMMSSACYRRWWSM